MFALITSFGWFCCCRFLDRNHFFFRFVAADFFCRPDEVQEHHRVNMRYAKEIHHTSYTI